jgi:hypothetical protein
MKPTEATLLATIWLALALLALCSLFFIASTTNWVQLREQLWWQFAGGILVLFLLLWCFVALTAAFISYLIKAIRALE